MAQPWQRPATTNVSKTRSCKYSLEAPDDERKYHSKHVEQSWNSKLSYTVASCWSFFVYYILMHGTINIKIKPGPSSWDANNWPPEPWHIHITGCEISTRHNIKHHKLHKHKEELLNFNYMCQPCPAKQPLGTRNIYNTASCSKDLMLTFGDFTSWKVQNVQLAAKLVDTA